MTAKTNPAKQCQFFLLALLSLMPFMGGCAHINVNQIAYEILRQEDCKLNQLDDFCTRTFANEYLEYEKIRQEFLRTRVQQTWRVGQDDIKLRTLSNSY